MATSHQSCIEACNACADACDRCAIACLQEPQPKLMARCVALDIDCAQACRLAAGYMARGSALDSAACAFSAMVCIECAKECEQHAMDHCRACADTCRACARECAQSPRRCVSSPLKRSAWQLSFFQSLGQERPAPHAGNLHSAVAERLLPGGLILAAAPAATPLIQESQEIP